LRDEPYRWQDSFRVRTQSFKTVIFSRHAFPEQNYLTEIIYTQIYIYTCVFLFSLGATQSMKIPQKVSCLNTAITLIRLLIDCYLLHYLPLISTDAFEMQPVQKQTLKFCTFSFQCNFRTMHCMHT